MKPEQITELIATAEKQGEPWICLSLEEATALAQQSQHLREENAALLRLSHAVVVERGLAVELERKLTLWAKMHHHELPVLLQDHIDEVRRCRKHGYSQDGYTRFQGVGECKDSKRAMLLQEFFPATRREISQAIAQRPSQCTDLPGDTAPLEDLR